MRARRSPRPRRPRSRCFSKYTSGRPPREIHVSSAYENDGFGLNGHGNITLSYTTPQYAIAFDFPGYLSIDLYWHGELIQSEHGWGKGPLFVGLISSQPFDYAILIDPAAGYQFIDDLHVDPRPKGDMDNDGVVNVPDLLFLLGQWGPCPNPPAECPADLEHPQSPCSV